MGMQPPLDGRLIVRLRSHPSDSEASLILEETFDPSELSGREVADAAIAALRHLEPALEYQAQVTESDTAWGADVSAVEVVLDISSRLADIAGVAALIDMVRRSIKGRRASGGSGGEQ
jgi:hypothetical protein